MVHIFPIRNFVSLGWPAMGSKQKRCLDFPRLCPCNKVSEYSKLYMLSWYYIIDDSLVLICGHSRHKCMSLYSLLGHKKINDASRHINLTMRFKFKNCWLDDDVQEDLESRALQLPPGQSIIVVESFMSAKDCKTSKSPITVTMTWI